MSKVKIRLATPRDVIVLMQMMRLYLQEQPMGHPEINESHTIRSLLQVIDMTGAYVAVADKKLIGSIGVMVDKYPWNQEYRFIYDEWFYVLPQYRKGTNAAGLLLEAVKKLSDSHNMPFVFSVNSGIDRRIDRYLGMSGFRYAGGIHIRASKGAEANG